MSIYTLLSMITFVSWKVWIIADRYRRTGSKSTPLLVMEAAYGFVMCTLLSTADNSFLVIAVLSALLHVIFGMYVEIFRPEVKLSSPSSRNALFDYWTFIIVDTAITLLSFLVMTGGTNG